MTRVLVIDDEPSILRALRINLTARNYEVSTASDGASGLLAVSRERPDAVILDLGLPDMDGTEVIHGVRGWSSDADHRACRCGARSPRRWPRSTPAPTTTSPSRSAWTNCSPGSGRRSAGRRPPRRAGRHHPDFTVDLAAKRVDAGRRRRPADPDRVAAAGDPGPQPGPPDHPEAAAPGRLGPGLRVGVQLPAGLHRPAPPQAGTRALPPPLPAHRAGHGLPLPGLALRRPSPARGAPGTGASRSPGRPAARAAAACRSSRPPARGQRRRPARRTSRRRPTARCGARS